MADRPLLPLREVVQAIQIEDIKAHRHATPIAVMAREAGVGPHTFARAMDGVHGVYAPTVQALVTWARGRGYELDLHHLMGTRRPATPAEK